MAGKKEEKISIGGVAKDVTIYKIHNSGLNLWTDSPNLTESVRLYTDLLSEVGNKIKGVVAMLKAVPVDFAIAASLLSFIKRSCKRLVFGVILI